MRFLLLPILCLVVLAFNSCTDDETMFVLNDQFAASSLSFAILHDSGSDSCSGITKVSDPWEIILCNVSGILRPTGKSGTDTTKVSDPWNTIMENFAIESYHVTSRKSGADTIKVSDPWNTVQDFIGNGMTHSPKKSGNSSRGELSKSSAFFVSLNEDLGSDGLAKVIEVHGQIAFVLFDNNDRQVVVNAPSTWSAGSILDISYHAYEFPSKKTRLTGFRNWVVVN